MRDRYPLSQSNPINWLFYYVVLETKPQVFFFLSSMESEIGAGWDRSWSPLHLLSVMSTTLLSYWSYCIAADRAVVQRSDAARPPGRDRARRARRQLRPAPQEDHQVSRLLRSRQRYFPFSQHEIKPAHFENCWFALYQSQFLNNTNYIPSDPRKIQIKELNILILNLFVKYEYSNLLKIKAA